ncbi:MAG: hypothetical protein NTY88_14410 [Bacteroidetes bacterium]|nr:hypothetical protein [Bacteroidota bacterium]
MSEFSISRQEMNCYTNYLLGKNADEQSLTLFERAIKQEATILNDEEEKLLRFMVKNLWSVTLLDAAFGMFLHKHKLRKRMIIAFAILETNPLYFDFFQPKQFSVFYFFSLSVRAFFQLLKALAGSIILLFS